MNRLLLVAFPVAFAAGCATHVSESITAEGKAGRVVFPDPAHAVLKEGTFPTRESIAQIGPGVTRDQLYDLLGRPHFHEGFNAREWDYLFHFREGGAVVTCQYKVIFDEQRRGQSFYWQPESCAQAEADAETTEIMQLELSADALFVFARGDRAAILPQGAAQIAKAAERLQDSRIETIRVVGHTDEIGSDADNQRLSQQRADTVRALLVENGINASLITATGMGERQPVVQCNRDVPRSERIACLQPNRRVEIAASASR